MDRIETWLRSVRTSIGQDLWSKLTDGLLAALILYLLWFFVTLSIRPIDRMFGQPGLLVYILGLLAVAMYALQHALFNHHAETTRAWYGIVAGSLAWSVTEISVLLGGSELANPGSVVLIIMLGLTVTILWRSGLQLGMKFFCITFLMNWSEHVVMRVESWLSSISSFFDLTYTVTGYIAILAGLITVGFILFHSKQRIERVSAALLLWFLYSLALYVFRGTLY